MGRKKERARQMTTISLPAEIGGKDAFRATNPAILLLRKLLSCHCRKPYGSISEIAPILRISGEVAQYGEEEYQNLSYDRSDNSVSVDVVIPARKWTSMSEAEFREYLFERVSGGIRVCVKELISRNFSIDQDTLAADLNRVKQLYVSPSDTGGWPRH